MISDKMREMLNGNSSIRAMFEEGKKLAKKYGKDNVYDFSLGNPNVKAPHEINQIIKDILNNEDSLLVHGYMSNAGYEDVRESIASYINKNFDTNYSFKNFVMTTGAAAALNICLKTILNKDDEVIIFSPYFVEYVNYIKNYDAKVVIVNTDEESFEPDIKALKSAITKRTKAIIINSPNNPTGVVYSIDILKSINLTLRKAEKELGIEILTISDEPYRDLIYEDIVVPWVPKYIKNTAVVYSYSKSLSLPGERIGWILLDNSNSEFEAFINALSIANRCTGSVNAPSLMQRVISKSLELRTDIEYYNRNRIYLYNMLQELGFKPVNPQGGFYIFMKTPIEDDIEFCNICKKYNILLVSGSSFGKAGYVRIAYCVSYEMIKKSREAFTSLARYFNLH